MWRKGLAIGITAVLTLAQEAPIRREGAHWVQVITGSIAIPSDCRLKVETRGPVTLRGIQGERVSYTIKKRVRARSEAEARALLNAAAVRTAARNGSAAITLAQRTRPFVTAEMELRSRPDLEEASVETVGGDVQIYDIQGTVREHLCKTRNRLCLSNVPQWPDEDLRDAAGPRRRSLDRPW